MEAYKLGEMEQKFADLIWEKEPIASGELAKLCKEAFGWKRTTMYTMLKRLCLRGIFKNEDGVVCALMTREEFLPRFLTAFSRRKRLSGREIAELKKLIEEYEEGEDG